MPNRHQGARLSEHAIGPVNKAVNYGRRFFQADIKSNDELLARQSR